MQLENPARQRRLADVAGPVPGTAEIARRFRNLDQRHRADTDLADALIRILRSSIGKELRTRIKEIAKNETD